MQNVYTWITSLFTYVMCMHSAHCKLTFCHTYLVQTSYEYICSTSGRLTSLACYLFFYSCTVLKQFTFALFHSSMFWWISFENGRKLNRKIAYNGRLLLPYSLTHPNPFTVRWCMCLQKSRSFQKPQKPMRKKTTTTTYLIHKVYQADRLAEMLSLFLHVAIHIIKKLKKQLKIWFMIYLFAL